MVAVVRGRALRRHLAGGSITLLGGLLLAVPLYDMWGDTTDLSWGILPTVVENTLFILLSAALVVGSVWLVRSDWETTHVITVARRTLLASAMITIVIGWAVLLQLVVMESLKPGVLALNGVLVGTVAAFGLSLSTVQADIFEQEAAQKAAINDRLEVLYEAANDLEGASTHAQAFEIVERAIGDVTSDTAFQIVVGDETVVDRVDAEHDEAIANHVDSEQGDPVATIPIGDRGRIDFFGHPLEPHEAATVELFGAHLEETVERIERETSIQDERDILEFVNRTLRHDLLGDLSLLQARLGMLDRNVAFEDDSHREHLTVALDRVEEMEDFVRTMRTYMQSVLDENHTLEAVAIEPLVDEHVRTFRQNYPDVEVEQGSIPQVAVMADELFDRVLVNLLTNAVEHNDAETPRVRIDGERHDETVVLRVADNGPGIDRHRRESIFDRGARGTDSDGSGFGLYLVNDVVENYDGHVRVSDNEPRGTVFELALPIASADR